jgi:hypothetical protein
MLYLNSKNSKVVFLTVIVVWRLYFVNIIYL